MRRKEPGSQKISQLLSEQSVERFISVQDIGCAREESRCYRVSMSSSLRKIDCSAFAGFNGDTL
jgi:hypothetical protein